MTAIRADIDQGRELGVNATPAVFVNGRMVPNYQKLGPILERVLENH
jgi:protein-disulfide isomerase